MSIRDNLLVVMGMYAGDMNRADVIDLPIGVEDENELAEYCVECVDEFLDHDVFDGDLPFDEFAENRLKKKFGWRVEDEYPDDDTPAKVIAIGGGVWKVLMEGTYAECEQFCDDHDWQWSEEPGGFVWELEVES